MLALPKWDISSKFYPSLLCRIFLTESFFFRTKFYMRMRQEHWANLNVCITGGVDGQGGGQGPLVVLLHGYGASGNDLVHVWPYLKSSDKVRFVFPEAPLSLNMTGLGDARAWWMLDLDRIMRARELGQWEAISKEIPEGLGSARQQVLDLLSIATERLAATPDLVVLGGFSQGAMLSIDVALHSEIPLAGLIVLSGTLIAREEWLARLPNRRGLPVFQSHGLGDPILAFSAARELLAHFQSAGLSVQWVECQGGHEISFQVLEDLKMFVQSLFSLKSGP